MKKSEKMRKLLESTVLNNKKIDSNIKTFKEKKEENIEKKHTQKIRKKIVRKIF